MISYRWIIFPEPAQRILSSFRPLPSPPAGNEYQKLTAPWLLVPLNVPTSQKGLDQLCAPGILGYQPGPSGLVYDEGLIQPGLDAIIDLPAHVLSQGDAGRFQLLQKPLGSLIRQGPAGLIQLLLAHSIAVLSDVFLQAGKAERLYLTGRKALFGLLLCDPQDAGIGGGLAEDGQISEVHYLLDMLLPEPAAQRSAIVGPHPLVGHYVGEEARRAQERDSPLKEVGIKVCHAVVDPIVSGEVILQLSQSLLADIGRIADHCIKSAPLENFRKAQFPFESIDPPDLLIAHIRMIVIIVVADERVAALDVLSQVRQSPLLEIAQKAADALLALALQNLEQQGELGHLHRLAVDVYPVDAALQNALSLRCGEKPFSAAVLEDGQRRLGRPDGNPPGPPVCPLFWGGGQEAQNLFRCQAAALIQHRGQVGLVPIQMPVQQILVGSYQKRARAAGGVQNANLSRL